MAHLKWGTNADGTIEYLSYNYKDHFDGVIQVLHQSFYPYESVSNAVGLATDAEAQKETDELVRNTLRDGVSLVAIEKSTGKLVGVAINKIQVKTAENEPFFEVFARTCKHQPSQDLIMFMKKADDACDLFELCNVDCLLELMFLAVLPKFCRRGIGTDLTNATIEVAKKLVQGENVKVPADAAELMLEPIPRVVASLLTSPVSQKLANTCGFKEAARISYENFHSRGRTFASILGDGIPDTTLVFKRL